VSTNKKYHSRRVVCVTVVPPYNQALYAIDKGVEATVIELLQGLGPYCRVSKHQWLVATDEPCGGIRQELEHRGVENVFVFAVLLDSDWQFSCKPKSEIDEWEFDGIAAFLQQKLGQVESLAKPGNELNDGAGDRTVRREVQKISLKSVWRGRISPMTRQEEAFGQVFAFDANVLEEQARAGDMTSHEVLLRLIVKGLWEARPKQSVLAGYIPGTERTPICRVYLLSARQLAWGAFHKSVHDLPGYMETCEDFILGSQHCPAVWWEYPCTMVALWPRLVEGDDGYEESIRLGGPWEEHGWFKTDKKSYHFINRYYELT
jgi:hypothetical protein